MQTALTSPFRDTPEGREADAILRSCVHCGFCLATCPTYRLLGDELDGPRGRIYLIKQVLEGNMATATTQLHLDRCLTCRNCETTCPSGVKYGRLFHIGRQIVEKQVGRAPAEQARRWGLARALLSGPLFGGALLFGRTVRALLPAALQSKVPLAQAPGVWPEPRHARRMLVLEGCVQPSLAPNIDVAMARVLDRIGVSLIRVGGGGCCGAIQYDMVEVEPALERMRRNIDAWWPHIERGAEAIVVTASGCGLMVKEYGTVLRADPRYAAKAARVAELTRDPVEVVAAAWPKIAPRVAMDHGSQRVAFHPPCTLQHGMKLTGMVEEILLALGLELVPVADAHLCCGSAGTYSILQPEIAGRLKTQKLAALLADEPEMIASANIGCIAFLATGTSLPVRHWIEILDRRMTTEARGL